MSRRLKALFAVSVAINVLAVCGILAASVGATQTNQAPTTQTPVADTVPNGTESVHSDNDSDCIRRTESNRTIKEGAGLPPGGVFTLIAVSNTVSVESLEKPATTLAPAIQTPVANTVPNGTEAGAVTQDRNQNATFGLANKFENSLRWGSETIVDGWAFATTYNLSEFEGEGVSSTVASIRHNGTKLTSQFGRPTDGGEQVPTAEIVTGTERLTLQPKPNQTIEGGTDLSAGSTVTVNLSSSNSSFSRHRETTVDDNGTFAASFNLSDIDRESTFVIVSVQQNGTELTNQSGLLKTETEPVAEIVTSDGELTLRPGPNQTIEGQTNLAPGSTPEVRIRSARESDSTFIRQSEATVSDNWTFAASFNLSSLKDEIGAASDIVVTVRHNETRLASQSGILRQDLAPTAEIVTDDRNLTLAAESGQTIEGRTDLPAESAVTVVLQSADHPFLRHRVATVDDDGQFAATFDLSYLEGEIGASSNVTVGVQHRETTLANKSGILVGEQSLTAEIVTSDTELTLQPEPDQTIKGTTNIAAGSELNITVHLSGSSFSRHRQTTVDNDGMFATTFNLSELKDEVSAGSRFIVTIRHDGTELATRSNIGTVPPSRTEVVTDGEELTVQPGPNQTIKGNTDRDPGSELPVILRSPDSSFVRQRQTTVTDNGTFATTFNLSEFDGEIGAESRVFVEVRGEPLTQPGIIVGGQSPAAEVGSDDAQPILEAESDQTIDGTTNIAAGSELTVTLQSAETPFVRQTETTVSDDGKFSATFDLSYLEDEIESNSAVTVTVRHDGTTLTNQSGIIERR